MRDCFGCPAFVKLNGDRYCAQQPARCYPAKRELYAQREIERVSTATGIPIATPADKATVLQVEYRDQPRVTSWLKAKTRPSHLRLVRVIDQPADKQNSLSTHTIRDVLKSREVLLASLDPAALRKAEDVPVKVAEETAAQKARREAAEEQARAERRAEKGLKRKAQADIDWLGLTAYKAVASQITASGATLEWLAGYVNDHSGIGSMAGAAIRRERDRQSARPSSSGLSAIGC